MRLNFVETGGIKLASLVDLSTSKFLSIISFQFQAQVANLYKKTGKKNLNSEEARFSKVPL